MNDRERYRAPVAAGLTVALIAIIVLVLTGTFSGSSPPKLATLPAPSHSLLASTAVGPTPF